jgi:hypothetical protein
MFDHSPFRTEGWPYAWPVGARVIEARPLAVRIEEAARLSGLAYTQILAFHEDGKLPFVDLGEHQLVMVRDLEKLLSQLPRIGAPPAPLRPSRTSRRGSPIAA